jgi:hypothetical protein
MSVDHLSPLGRFGGRSPSFFPTYEGEERNRTSMLLSLIETVRPLSVALFAGLTSSASSRTVVEARLEPTGLTTGPGAPDAVVSVRFGTLPAWRCLIEVKSRGELKSDQIARYYEAAKQHRLDHVLTISRAIQSGRQHPSGFDPGELSGRPGLSHISWLEIDNAILAILGRSEHAHGLEPSSRRLLADFHHYLRKSSVETVGFSTLGAPFNRLRQLPVAAVKRPANAKDVAGVATAWSALIRAEALRLGSIYNTSILVSSPTRTEMVERELRESNSLKAAFRTPSTGQGRIETTLDLPSRRLELVWTLDLDAALGARTRAPRRWAHVNDSLGRFTNGRTQAVVRGSNRHETISGPLGRVAILCESGSTDAHFIPRRLEVRRPISLQKLTAQTVGSRLHAALTKFTPWAP